MQIDLITTSLYNLQLKSINPSVPNSKLYTKKIREMGSKFPTLPWGGDILNIKHSMNHKNILTNMSKLKIWRLFLIIAIFNISACGDKQENSPQLKNLDQQPIAAQFYEATLQEGIDFKKSGLPRFLVALHGFSENEEWGRWTDQNISKVATISFKDALPQKFDLELQANSIGANVGAAIGIKIGSYVQYIKLKNWPDSSIYKLKFDIEKDIKTIEINAPNYYQPKEVEANNSDTRKLGIGMISLKIKE